MTIILGIDPGSNCTGYGIIESNGRVHRYIASGCVRVKKGAESDPLLQIFEAIDEVIGIHQPTEAAVEQIFVNVTNPNSALKLGQARGVAIVAVARRHLKIAEYTARQVKQATVGYGAATKAQVQQMVKLLLKLDVIPPEDAADALAVALCHANTSHTLAAIVKRTRL